MEASGEQRRNLLNDVQHRQPIRFIITKGQQEQSLDAARQAANFVNKCRPSELQRFSQAGRPKLQARSIWRARSSSLERADARGSGVTPPTIGKSIRSRREDCSVEPYDSWPSARASFTETQAQARPEGFRRPRSKTFRLSALAFSSQERPRWAAGKWSKLTSQRSSSPDSVSNSTMTPPTSNGISSEIRQRPTQVRTATSDGMEALTHRRDQCRSAGRGHVHQYLHHQVWRQELRRLVHRGTGRR